MSVAAVSGLMVRPLIGWALDSLGRKPTVVVGTLLVAAGMALVAAVDRIGPMIYLQRVVLGVGLAALFTAYFTFAADIIPAERRTEGLALFGISGLVPLLVNPFADQVGIEPAQLRWFLPAVGALILVSLVAVVRLPEPRPSAGVRISLLEAFHSLRKRPLWPVWLASTVFSGLVAVFMTFATVTAERRGIDRPASLWLTYALGAVAVRAFGARLPDRIGPANLVAPAMAFYLAGCMVAAEASSLGGFFLAGLLAGVGHGYLFPVLTSQVVSRTPERFRGSALATFTALWGISELAISPLFGAVADAYGDGAMFYLAVAFGLTNLVLWLALEHRFGGTPAISGGNTDG
jgi:MFS family permease